MDDERRNITELLSDHAAGRSEALDLIVPLVYDELRRIAASRMRHERADHTLQPTALVNEAWMRLAAAPDARFENRAHFFGIAARLMRQILVDHARGRGRDKRGGDQVRVTLDESVAVSGPEVDLLSLDAALERLAATDTTAARVVELRYFSGLGIEETATVLGVSPATVKRDWAVAKAFLRREMRAV